MTVSAQAPPDPREPVERLLRDLRARRDGLSARDAQRRLVAYGPNEIRRSGGRLWPRELARQFTHPLALLLWAAGVLAYATGSTVVAAAIGGVIVVNALFAFVQERQAERAVEALSRYLPPTATVLRDGRRLQVEARELVPGDVLLIEEGDGISADARLLEGSLELDLSALTGESLPVLRSAEHAGLDGPLLEARDLVFSGTSCTGGEAKAIVVATGMRTELGRIAALSQRVRSEESPLERQVRRVAWVIALVAVGVGVAFLPLGMLAGLSFGNAAVFAVGLLVSNVPEGLLPTITLALAVGVRVLARRRALVKRLSAVETLGSTTVVCTDKTGTLTENRMHATSVWSGGLPQPFDTVAPTAALRSLARVVSTCNNAELEPRSGDATELALLEVAARFRLDVSRAGRERSRRRQLHFDPALKLMSTIDEQDGRLVLATKGAPEEVLARSRGIAAADGSERDLTEAERAAVVAAVEAYASQGLRVLAGGCRPVAGDELEAGREQLERDLVFLGLVALVDPARAEVPEAVRRCREAGIRIIVVTGDHGRTAAAVARRVGIVGEAPTVVTGAELDALDEPTLDRLLHEEQELIFARSSPEAKLRIADALRAHGEVVAMTGDGVNDAPALRRADIGVAMGRSGTDVAREAATMILTDDDFASIVTAIEEGRRVYANVRKFIFYIFAHATPEVVPFLLFALSGGAIPLPLTVLQILAIDLGTETLPALALGREPAEPGVMQQRPRARSEGVIRRDMLVRAWGLLGGLSAAAVLGGFFFVLLRAGWAPGVAVGHGSALHHAYLEATSMTFLGIVACQVGTALAARTERVSLRAVGLFSNRLLLWGIAFELVFAAALVYAPPLQGAFGTASVGWQALLLLPAFPLLVWGADELRRKRLRAAARGVSAELRPPRASLPSAARRRS